mgnify:CR=1 FL=1
MSIFRRGGGSLGSLGGLLQSFQNEDGLFFDYGTHFLRDTGVDVCDMMTEEILVEDLKTLDSHIINVYLVAAVQELKAELDAAKARITELES